MGPPARAEGVGRPVEDALALASKLRLYDDGVAAIRFPSHLDGNPCIAVFERRGALHLDGAIVPLTDPSPGQLLEVAAAWHLTLQPSPSITEPA
jgi:hypothetical protein